MAEFSSTLNEEKNPNRSYPSRMLNIGQTPLARLRPDKLDDAAIKEQISIIQGICGDVDPDIIAIVFHECDYNLQNTVARIKKGDFEDGGWQTAKSNNKKKNHTNLTDHITNGGTHSDSERSLSQRTSPTLSLRRGGRGRRRPEHLQYPSRPHTGRRGNDIDQNNSIPLNSRKYPNTKTLPTQHNPSDMTSSSKQNQDITPTPSTSTDEYDFNGGASQSLTFDNSLKKTPVQSSVKHPLPSVIPQEPVSMHSTLQLSTKPLDIQFGDVQWNDSVPFAVTPSDSSSSLIPIEHEQQTTNETTDQLSITNNSIANNLSVVPLEETSQSSDHLANSSQQQTSSSLISDLTYLPPTLTPNPFISNNLSNTNTASGSNPSAFTPYDNYPSTSRDYQNYKAPQKSTMYPQQPLPTHQQIYLGAYPYHPSVLYPVMTPLESWSTAGYESYSAYPQNYIPAYPTQQAYHPATVQSTKYDQYPQDKDFFAHYGQPRTDLSNSSQSAKDVPSTSKLSATAASFPQGTPGTAYYINPVVYQVPAYYSDRTLSYPSVDNRDNRNGAFNRSHYHHQQQQQQRTHNNSTWHSQQ